MKGERTMNENETVFREILEELVKREFAEFDDPENIPEHKLSLKHCLAMRRIFARYERNVRKLKKARAAAEMPEKTEYIPQYSLKQRIIIALVIIVLMTLLTGWYIPIRGITQVQIDWLRSRYDFPNMKMQVSILDEAEVYTSGDVTVIGAWRETDEYRNFLADLVDLGIYTEQELKTIKQKRAPIDKRSAPEGYEVHFEAAEPDFGEESPLESYRRHISFVENRIEYYNKRSKDPAQAWEGDAEFAELIKENYLPLPKSFLELLEKLYADIPDEKDNQKIFLSDIDKDSRVYLSKTYKI